MCDRSTENVRPEHVASLVGSSSITCNERIVLSKSQFVIGRCRTASYNIPHVNVSKQQCIFRFCGEQWTVCDMSKFGTFINNKRIEFNQPKHILDGDELRFGLSDVTYKFVTSSDVAPANKKSKLNVQNQELNDGKKKLLQDRRSAVTDNKNHTTTAGECEKLRAETASVQKIGKAKGPLEPKHTEEMRVCQEGLRKFCRRKSQEVVVNNQKIKGDKKDNAQQDKLKELKQLSMKHAREVRDCKKQLTKENKILEKKLNETQKKLKQKEKKELILNKKLQAMTEQRLKDKKQQDAKKATVEALRAKVAAKEEIIKSRLQAESMKLENEKENLENKIERQQLIKEGKHAKMIKQLTEELDKVKAELANTEGKKQFLEKELENAAIRTQELLTESSLKAKQEVLQYIGELVESELQCSICNELFVRATTLNCTHTFCHSCLLLWKEQKEECPVCRTPIIRESRSIVLDTFIDRIAQNLTTDVQNKRKEIVAERTARDVFGVPEPGTSEQEREEIPVYAYVPTGPPAWNAYVPVRLHHRNMEPIVISDSSSSDNEAIDNEAIDNEAIDNDASSSDEDLPPPLLDDMNQG